MSTVIRMARGGTKKRPFYRIVVADKRSPRDGKFIERIGSYNPLLAEKKSTVDTERARYWLGTGAWPSDRVRKLLELHGVQVKARKGMTGPGKPPPRQPRKARKAAAPAAAAEAEKPA
ncbi:MAG TPA: 30S ribosomal protein S16 [bacterium]|nr:30S ribosomal protein S16 [bacterium]